MTMTRVHVMQVGVLLYWITMYLQVENNVSLKISMSINA